MGKNGSPRSIFMAGIIQGSHTGKGIHVQDYRPPIQEALRSAFPEATIYDPVAEYPGSVDFDPEKGRAVFLDLMKRAGEADLLVAFLPAASMGTAIEFWEARRNGTFVAAITEMTENWAVKFLAHRLYPDIESFARSCEDGSLQDAYRNRS